MFTTKFCAPFKTTTNKGSLWKCQNVPHKILNKNNEIVKLQPFNSKTSIIVNIDYYLNDFYEFHNDEEYIYTPHYPNGKIPITEFDIKPISIKKLKTYFAEYNIINAIEKVEHDSFQSKGNNNCITIDKYKKFISNPSTSKLERIGDPIFNRSVRHSPPISKLYTREEFENCLSYPAPIGIREEDFALPSEQNKILIELLNQIFSCKNAPLVPIDIQNELKLNIIPNSHKCLWCGDIIDIAELNQKYCSKVHSINFCHRIPEIGTKLGNVYIGHYICNREQGGYSEEQRIEQIIRLAKNNPIYKQKILNELI